jgi:hypothetical protein
MKMAHEFMFLASKEVLSFARFNIPITKINAWKHTKN